MRKALLWLMMLAAMLVCIPAVAETYVFDELYASMDVPDHYIVLTKKNLDSYAGWLEARGTSLEDTIADFDKRGVLLQAWTPEDDTCFELRANTSAEIQLMYDINEQAEDVRGQYRTSHYPRNEYLADGFDFSSSEWKKTEEGRFLCLQYVHRDNGEILHRGFMRRTVRNGFEIDFDMQAHGRSLTNKDNANLNKIWESFHFIEVRPLPPAASAKINIKEAPPQETNEQSFKIEGTAAEGVKLTAVVMGLTHPDPVVTDVVAGKNGKFSLPIKLPREGVFLITLTGEYQDEEVVELAYPVTYQSTLLAVNFINQPSGTVMQDEVKISGTGEPGASIQVFVNGQDRFTKRVTSAGKFSFEVEAEEEGPYEVMLVFSKKGLADRRFLMNFTRKWTEADNMAYLNKQSISPTYSQLKKNMAKYEGRIMSYRAYLVDVGPSGDEYIVRMALSRKNGKYSNYILVAASEEPAFEAGERVTMYGTCEGMSLSTGTEGETGDESYPCFALLMFASLE